jgi:hypothetical protein
MLVIFLQAEDGIVVFFLKQETGYGIRIRDWSSGVCSFGFGTGSNFANAEATAVDIGAVFTLTIPKAIKICNAPLTITLVNSGADTTNYQGIIVDIDRLV